MKYRSKIFRHYHSYDFQYPGFCYIGRADEFVSEEANIIVFGVKEPFEICWIHGETSSSGQPLPAKHPDTNFRPLTATAKYSLNEIATFNNPHSLAYNPDRAIQRLVHGDVKKMDSDNRYHYFAFLERHEVIDVVDMQRAADYCRAYRAAKSEERGVKDAITAQLKFKNL